MERGSRVLVAGATGRVGSAAVRHLLGAGYEVRALVRRAEKAAKLRELGAEVVIGDVTKPDTLGPAVEGCRGVFSALAAGPGRGDAQSVEYRGNVNLLRAAEAAGVRRFVYSSALMADHPLAREVAEFREKAHFEGELAEARNVSHAILRPAMFMETLLMPLQGPVAFVPGRQRLPVSWISAEDIGRAAARAFERDIEGRHELAGPDRCTWDEAYARIGEAGRRRITVLHPPVAAMSLPGRFVPQVGDLARMFAFFDAAGYATDPASLREVFGVEAISLREWGEKVFRSGTLG